MKKTPRLLLSTLAAWIVYQALWRGFFFWKLGAWILDDELTFLGVTFVAVAAFCAAVVLAPLALLRFVSPQASSVARSATVAAACIVGVTWILAVPMGWALDFDNPYGLRVFFYLLGLCTAAAFASAGRITRNLDAHAS